MDSGNGLVLDGSLCWLARAARSSAELERFSLLCSGQRKSKVEVGSRFARRSLIGARANLRVQFTCGAKGLYQTLTQSSCSQSMYLLNKGILREQVSRQLVFLGVLFFATILGINFTLAMEACGTEHGVL